MKPTLVRIEDVASRDTLGWAVWRAARGKRVQAEVRQFLGNLDAELNRMQAQILAGTIPVGRYRAFEIRDPKLRTIHAPVFAERVLHHALMAHIEPILERYLVDDSFACRPGKGTSAALARSRAHLGRWPWYLQMDVRRYFASIDHERLRSAIRRRIKGERVLALLDRIIASHESSPGRGLPIGALTSQHLANLYLAPLDRFLLEELRVGGLVRYMDDVVVWHGERAMLRRWVEVVRAFSKAELGLEIKPSWRLQRSDRGLTFAGLRLFANRTRLTARRRRRYRLVRARWEAAYRAGTITVTELQAGFASARAMTEGTDSLVWRLRQLETTPAVEA